MSSSSTYEFLGKFSCTILQTSFSYLENKQYTSSCTYDKTHEMLWNQRLIHLASQSINEAHKYADGIPNLLKFRFDDLSKFSTHMQANITKNSPGRRSITKSVCCPYQGLFIDFGFSGCISKDNHGNVIESSFKDIEGLNGKKALILISDAQTKTMHVNT